MKSISNDTYVKSPFMQVVRDGDSAVIWHSLFGYPKIVSVKTLCFLDSFLRPAKIYSQFNGKLTDQDNEAIKELIRCYFLVPEDFNDREFLKKQMQKRETKIINGSLIDYLELIVSEACNFRCTYCIHFNNIKTSKRITNSKKFMQFEIAKKAVDQYLKILHKHGKRIAEINFGGGEPLLAWLVIKQILKYCTPLTVQNSSFTSQLIQMLHSSRQRSLRFLKNIA